MKRPATKKVALIAGGSLLVETCLWVGSWSSTIHLQWVSEAIFLNCVLVSMTGIMMIIAGFWVE
jgi:hypothetical protein